MTKPAVRIELLGPVRAWRGSEPVALRGASARTVLACLALSPGSVVAVDELSAALWEDDPPANATSNLQSIVSRLRTGLGSATIETRAPGYRLADTIVTDLAALQELLRRSTTEDPAVDARALSEALAGWDGPALAGVAPTTWFEPDLHRLAELRLAVADSRNQLLIAEGRVEEAIAELRHDAAAEPLREPTQLLLAEALHRAGRDADALRVVHAYRRALADETGLEPSPAVRETEARLLQGSDHDARSLDRPRRRLGARRWLPPDTPFVGRDQELTQLRELSRRHRLVTVVGPGGVGKSRLVMQLLDADDPDCVVVLLAPVDPAAAVDAALAEQLGLESTGPSMRPAIVERLSMQPATVVLDNCEHVLEPTRGLVEELLSEVRELTVIATSRQRLGLAEENVLALDPLDVPAEADACAPALQLFGDRVRRASPQVALSEHDIPLVTDICRLLGGLPLALELAAARVQLFGLAELRRQLVLGWVPEATGAGTMEEAVRWSLDLLGSEARTLFGDVCVFPSWFTLEAVAAVASLDVLTPALGELVDASLVSVGRGSSQPSFRMLEPIRQVGIREVPGRTRSRYLEWVLGLGAQAEHRYHDGSPASAFALLDEHHDDFRHALTLLLADDDERGGRLARQLAFPLSSRQSTELVELILEIDPRDVDSLLALAILEWGVGKPERSVEHAEAALDQLDPADERTALAWRAAGPAFSFLGDIDRMVACSSAIANHPGLSRRRRATGIGLWALGECYRGNLDGARRVLAEHAEIVRCDPGGWIEFVRAEIAAPTDTDEALAWLEVGAVNARDEGDFLMTRMIEIAQLATLVRTGDYGRAAGLARGIIDELLRAGLVPQCWMALRHAAALLAADGDNDTAAWILDSARASSGATELVGEAVAEEVALRERIESALGGTPQGTRRDRPPVPAAELWPEVEAALRRAETGQSTNA